MNLCVQMYRLPFAHWPPGILAALLLLAVVLGFWFPMLYCWLLLGAAVVFSHATMQRPPTLVQATANSMPDAEKPTGEAAAVTTLAVKNNNTTEFLRFQEMIWLQSDQNCVTIQTTRKKFVLYRSLRSIETELDPQQFVRIHRSAIINRHFIQSIHHLPGGDGYVALSTGEEIRYSRNFKKGLVE